MRRLIRLLAAAVFPFCVTIGAAQQPPRVEPEITKLPLKIDGRTVDVITHIYKPPGDGPFPLVIFSHGRAGSRVERASMKYPMPVGHGNWWLARGVALIAPVRPGYGETGGSDRESSGVQWRGSECVANPDYKATATHARETLVAAYEWALGQPWVRKDRILFEGQSVGGLATVAVSALNLPGVVGTVNFAGGSGGYPDGSPGKSCWPAKLTDLYGEFGREAKAPSLWLYAPNDLYWGAEVPPQWHAAYKAGGSDTLFVQTAPVEGADGHHLLNVGGRMWSGPLNAFMKKVGLTAP